MFADDIGPSTKIRVGYMMSITVMNVIMDSYLIPKSQLSHFNTLKIGNAVNFMTGKQHRLVLKQTRRYK